LNPVTVTRGDGPVILGQPHGGTFVPDAIYRKLNGRGRVLGDTDWHIGTLYDGLLDGATIVRANFHRYVVDANRDPAGTTLYPGQNTTGLVPGVSFNSEPIWSDPAAATEDRDERLGYHHAYHAALHAEIERLRASHAAVVLYDCHSIRSELPFLFEGRLPDLNIGDNDGRTCAPALTKTVTAICAGAGAGGYSHVVNGRFRGGWTVRRYGRPGDGVHAIQMEITQRCYLEDECPPFAMDAAKTEALRSLLRPILVACDRTAREGALSGAGHG
jgi:formiminoglutamase